MTFNLSNVARGLGRNRLPKLTFVAVCALTAAVGCGDDGTATGPQGTAASPATAAGTGAAGTTTTGAAGAATTGAAGATTGAAGAATTGAAGATTGAAGATTGVAGAATTGAAGATTGAAGAATTGAAGATTGAAGATTGGVAGAATGAAGAGTTGGAATLTMVYDTIYMGGNCGVCHGMAPSNGVNGNLGMIRNKDAFFTALVGKPTQGTACMGKGNYVVAGSPETSVLVQKLSSPPPCGEVMPLGSMLGASDVALLTAWVKAGALNN